MNIIEAVVLGIVQGLTEFLPVSSSGHLVLLQKLFGISEPALFFDTMLHAGTLAAVCVVLWKDIAALLRHPLQPLTGLLIIATIPAVIIALVFKDTIEAAFHSASFLGFAFLITAAALFISEALSRRAGKIRGQDEMKWSDALIMGILQGAAIMPGVSRSGFTLSGALSRKIERGFAARFSFLMSIPAILGALVLQLKDIIFETSPQTAGIGAAPIIAGTAVSAAVGFFAVRFMLKIVREKSLIGFAVYVAVLGVLVLMDQYITHLFF
ncbi:undecaprenyl-diphosphate phosphatase [Treponema sp. OttesenSCG-928-L16]|nr:undecaprenyl-diphosphate phosphatase [Treponema sp. OttesenSCG-928-L16]